MVCAISQPVFLSVALFKTETLTIMPFASTNTPSIPQQSAEIEAVLGPPLRHSVIALSGVPVLHRTIWICGCSVDFADQDGDQIDAVGASLRWHRCAYHRRVGPVFSAV
jgi:hypothetical protein